MAKYNGHLLLTILYIENMMAYGDKLTRHLFNVQTAEIECQLYTQKLGTGCTAGRIGVRGCGQPSRYRRGMLSLVTHYKVKIRVHVFLYTNLVYMKVEL